ncbi:MAG: futalosine hydrolase [Phycisphaerales bacterium JB059]
MAERPFTPHTPMTAHPDTPPRDPSHPDPDHPDGRAVLLAIAAPLELKAVGLDPGTLRPWEARRLAPGVEVVLTGVGKANAAGGVSRVLDPARHAGVVSLGIGGTLDDTLPLGALVLGESSLFADEGVRTPEGFTPCAQMGFALTSCPEDEIRCDPRWMDAWRGRVDRVARIATVSTCSGTDGLAREIRARTGAAVEAMEGAAVGLATRALHPAGAFAELRVVSNTTGDRGGQRWALEAAMGTLSGVLGRLGLVGAGSSG